MSLHWKAAGVWKPAKAAYWKAAGVWKPAKQVWRNVAGVWEVVLAAFAATVVKGTYTVTQVGTTTNYTHRQRLSATLSGGTGPFTYLWSFTKTGGSATASLSSTTSATPDLVATINETTGYTVTGTVSVTVTDSAGFTATDTEVVTLG